MQLDLTMYNKNQKRDDDGAASLGDDDAQVNVAGKKKQMARTLISLSGISLINNQARNI